GLARVPPLLECLGDLAEGRRIVDRCGQRVVLTVGDPLHRPAQDLPRARLRQALDDERGLEGGHGPDLLAHALDQLARDVGVAPLDPRLGDDEAHGHLALISSATPTTAHSATSGWPASTSSIAPVESRWPATLMMSSVRPITHR